MSEKKSKIIDKKSKPKKPVPRDIKQMPLKTQIIDDVFVDDMTMLKPKFEVDYEEYLNHLWRANPLIYNILKSAHGLEGARDKLYSYLDIEERAVFNLDNKTHTLEKATIRESIRSFRSIIGPINESRTSFSALDCLWKLANKKADEIKEHVSIGFIMEFIHLFKAVAGKSNIYKETVKVKKNIKDFFHLEGREAAIVRDDVLDNIGSTIRKYFKKYPSGLDEEIVSWREENRYRILKYFEATKDDWKDYKWHLKNVIRDEKPLLSLIEVTKEQARAIKKAGKNHIPFGITPYYLSLMDNKMTLGYDHAVRAQVLPPPDYVDTMTENKAQRALLFDFMGEHETSPVDLITRRYPGICIIKPFNTCSQICVYCQRNWEIDEVLDAKAMASEKELDEAMEWLDRHRSIGDVLVTGGDPCVMNDHMIDKIIGKIADKKHVFRIRIGTRTPVVLPMRWTDKLIEIMEKYHEPGKREIAIVTHFEHSYEITPDSMEAIQKIKRVGIGVYNQEVFTIENSRRFETAKLRKDLRLIGVDPYYTFNLKGKEETRRYMVPIARILQERKEEARLRPGLDRTDEPVFNVPKLGKNHLRSWQDHRLVMILPNGSRVYEFHPWEKNITPVPPYNYIDVPIYDYLEELAVRGENISDYRTIWYYY